MKQNYFLKVLGYGEFFSQKHSLVTHEISDFDDYFCFRKLQIITGTI